MDRREAVSAIRVQLFGGERRDRVEQAIARPVVIVEEQLQLFIGHAAIVVLRVISGTPRDRASASR